MGNYFHYSLFIIGLPAIFIGYSRGLESVMGDFLQNIGYIILTARLGYLVFDERTNQQKTKQYNILKEIYQDMLSKHINRISSVKEDLFGTLQHIFDRTYTVDQWQKDLQSNFDIQTVNFLDSSNSKHSIVLKKISQWTKNIQTIFVNKKLLFMTSEEKDILMNASLLHQNILMLHQPIKDIKNLYYEMLKTDSKISQIPLNQYPDNTLGKFMNTLSRIDQRINGIKEKTQFEQPFAHYVFTQQGKKIDISSEDDIKYLRSQLCSTTFIDATIVKDDKFIQGICIILFVIQNAKHIYDIMQHKIPD